MKNQYHDDLDLAVRSWREIPEGPDVFGAGIGQGIGIYENRSLIIFFSDNQVHGLQLIVSVSYGVGYLPPGVADLGPSLMSSSSRGSKLMISSPIFI